MTDTAPNHYSHSFVLNLDKLPTKKSDRIALHILYRPQPQPDRF